MRESRALLGRDFHPPSPRRNPGKLKSGRHMVKTDTGKAHPDFGAEDRLEQEEGDSGKP